MPNTAKNKKNDPEEDLEEKKVDKITSAIKEIKGNITTTIIKT